MLSACQGRSRWRYSSHVLKYARVQNAIASAVDFPLYSKLLTLSGRAIPALLPQLFALVVARIRDVADQDGQRMCFEVAFPSC